MYLAKNTIWTIAVCLMMVVGIFAQAQPQTRIMPGNNSTLVSGRVEPDSPSIGSSVASGPQAVVPRLMKFSGTLRDSSGKPLTGTVDVTFALYNTETVGNPLWFETQTVQADELGRYTALLGSMHTEGLPLDLFTSGEVRWLGIQVGLEAEQPRVLLVSVPYALKAGDAETLGGKPASAYMLSDVQSASASSGTPVSATGTARATGSGKNQKSRTANTTPLTAACSSITSIAGGAINSIPRFTAACNIETSVITQSGSNVGIGTASPAYKLDVVGGSARVTNPSGTTQLQVSGSASSGRLGQDAGGFFFASDTNGESLRFLTNNGALHEWMRVTSAGNVGIGTTVPAHILDVSGDVSAKTAMIVDGAGLNNAAVSPGLTFGTASEEGIASKRTSGGNQFGLDFYTGATNRMSITRTGLVGIGTTAPSYALDVVGNIRALTAMNVDGLGVNSGSLSSGLTFGAGSGEGIASKRTAGGNQYGLDFYTQFADRMSIRQSGQVGIGTSNPYTSLHIREDVAGGLGPTLLLMNGGAGGNAGASIDWDGYDPGSSNLPSARMQSYDDGNFSSHLTFQTKVPGAATNALVEQVRITSTGSLIVDSSAQNTGTLSGGTAGGAGLIFGGSGSGEGIASCRTGNNCPLSKDGSFSAPEPDGLNFYTAYAVRMIITNLGDTNFLGCSFWANGDSQGSCLSDARLKTNIQRLTPVLDKVARLRPVQFNYRAAEYPQYGLPTTRMTGLIAQEVESEFPELVSTGKDGFKRLDSGPLKFLLLEGVRELKERNDSLRREVGEQRALLRQAREKNRAQETEIRKLAGQVQELTQEQTEIASLKARLDRLERSASPTRRVEGPHTLKGKLHSQTQVARARF